MHENSDKADALPVRDDAGTRGEGSGFAPELPAKEGWIFPPPYCNLQR
jgi:hypothetical protein